ncbi:MAG: DMT family transporter [Odoribacteraceae bacterium]|jgi:drug/metabolite transporter (DMT)-like permease|nr:DMT family transporter [Odoribacteraceae bacterium]
MTKEKWNGHLAIFTTNILFGLNISVSKMLLSGWISPVGLTFARMIFGAIAFWTLSLFLKRERVSGRDMLILLACALLGITVNQTFFIFGLERTSPIDAGLIATLNPMLVMLIAAAVLKEPITWKKAGGVFIGACGALLIIWQSASLAEGGKEGSLSGNLFCLLSVVSYCIYIVISRPIAQRYGSVTLMKWMFLFATVMLFPFGAGDLTNARVFSPDSSLEPLLSLFYVLAGATFLAYLLIPMALKRIRPTTISMYNYLQPIVAGIAAILVGQSVLTWDKPVATILIFSGVYLVTRSKSRADIERARREMLKENGENDASRKG